MMKILILGGTGAMGIHLVKLLSNEKIFVTTRRQRISTDNISYIQGDAHDLNFLRPLLEERFDVIVDFMFYGTEEFRERCPLFLNSCKQYVFLSSSRVYAGSDVPITESSPRLLDVCKDEAYLATDEYALAKARQENILRESGHSHWTIIRPYITYSEIRLQLGVLEKEGWLYRALHGRTIVFSNDIAGKVTTLTYGLDVAKGIVSLIGNPEACGEAFHITTSKVIRWEDVFSIYLSVYEEKMGYRPNVLMTETAMNLDMAPYKYQVVYDRLYDRSFNNDKIGKYIDVSQFVDPREGLKKCLGEFLSNPVFSMLSGRMEGKKDRLTKEKTPFGELTAWRQKAAYWVYRHIL